MVVFLGPRRGYLFLTILKKSMETWGDVWPEPTAQVFGDKAVLWAGAEGSHVSWKHPTGEPRVTCGSWKAHFLCWSLGLFPSRLLPGGQGTPGEGVDQVEALIWSFMWDYVEVWFLSNQPQLRCFLFSRSTCP